MARPKKGAQERAATLVFVDESGFSLKPSVRRTWAPKGKTPVLRHRLNWKRLNALGALACQPDGSHCELLLHWQEPTINQDAVCAFVDALHQQIAGFVTLLWDGLPAHRSKKTQAHVAEAADGLSVHRLPAYAPELNPVEYVWSAIKGKDVAGLCADTLPDIEVRLQAAHTRLHKEQTVLQGCLIGSTLFDKATARSST